MAEDNAENESGAGRSAAVYFKHDPSLACLLEAHGVRVRDFMMLSFLSDQGTMSVAQLSGAIGIEAEKLLNGVKRLSAAESIVRGPSPEKDDVDSEIQLTSHGIDVARRIDSQF